MLQAHNEPVYTEAVMGDLNIGLDVVLLLEMWLLISRQLATLPAAYCTSCASLNLAYSHNMNYYLVVIYASLK